MGDGTADRHLPQIRQSPLKWGSRCEVIKMNAQKISPRSKLGPAGKSRPPKIEKLKGDELPPPETAKAEIRKTKPVR